MNEIILEKEYSDGNIIIYFSYVTYCFYRQSTITDIEEISFEEVIREIDTCPTKSQIWKKATILKWCKILGLQKEVA